MLKQLRVKFVLINMILVSLVLLIVFVALCLSTYSRLSEDADQTLRNQIEFSGLTFKPEIGNKPSGHQGWSQTASQSDTDITPPEGDAFPGENGDRHGVGALEPAFYVQLDANGSVVKTQTENVTISDETLQLAIEAATAAEKNSGDISSLNLRYLRVSKSDGCIDIAFLDMTGRTSSMQRLVLQSLAIGFGGLVCFFLISLLLSRLALKPVELAWAQQRQFVADASHELKTPLTVILANSSILLANPKSTVSEQRQWIENTQDEGKRMKGLIDDMLYLAKSDAQKLKTAHVCFCLSDEAENGALRFESLAFERGVTLDTDIAPNLYMKGDQTAIRQMLGTLLDNACKYAGENGRALLRLKRAGDALLLSVWNTGDPIPAEAIPHLFDRFYRADSARAGTSPGYGLGLSIAKSIADTHAARIWVESRAGEGTTFTVRLASCRAPQE